MDHHDSRGSLWALLLGTLAFTLCFTVWGLISPLAPMFRQQYGLSTTQVGLLVATPVILGALFRIPAGMLTDRFGGRIVFPALMLLLVPTVALAALSQSFGMLLVAALLLGMSGASFAVGIPYVAQWFSPSRQGFALGVYGIGNIGTAFAAIIAPRFAAGIGWTWAFWIWVPVLVALAAGFYVTGRDSPAFTPRTDGVKNRLRLLWDRPVSWVLIVFYFVTFGGFVAIGAFLPTLLVSEYGLTQTDAGARTAGFVILATLVRPIGGYLSDWTGGRNVLTGVFTAVAFFAVLLAFQPGMTGITIGFLGAAAALGVGNGAVFKLVPELFPAETGTVAGLVGAAGGLGGFFPPIVMGAVHDVTGSYAVAFVLLSAFSLGCLLINLLALGRSTARAH